MRDRRRETRVRFTTGPLRKAGIFRSPVTIRRCRFGRTSRGVARRRQDDLRLDSTRVVVVRAYSLRERACEEIEQIYKYLSFPRKNVRRNRETLLLFVIPAKAGICLRRFRKKNRAGIVGGRLRIPAFERVKKSKSCTNTRHSRESGNLLAAFPQGKPGRYSGRPPPDSRFRGNDEVLFDGYCLLQFRYLGDPSVTMRGARFLHTIFRGNDEVLSGGYCLYNADTSAIRPSR